MNSLDQYLTREFKVKTDGIFMRINIFLIDYYIQNRRQTVYRQEIDYVN